MTNTPFIYEFLYRGNADGSGAWHLVLGSATTDGFGNTHTTIQGPLSISAATAQNYALPAIVAAINAATLAQVETLKAQLTSAAGQIQSAQTQIAAMQTTAALLSEASSTQSAPTDSQTVVSSSA